MKKALIGAVCVLLVLSCLVGCSSSGELEEFAETYNKRASAEDVAELLPEEFGDIEKYEDEEWRRMYESDKYEIVADYDGTKILGYSLTIDSGEPFVNKEGEGYRAGTVIARTLGLSVGEYVKNYEKALKSDSHSYKENGYKVSFTNIGWDSTIPTSIFIHFTKDN